MISRDPRDSGDRREDAFLLRAVRQVKAGRVLLRDIDLRIPAGRITALLGPSGAGKTSLLRLLNRLDDPIRGEVRYLSRPIASYPVTDLRRRIGFVSQIPVLFIGSVRDNLGIAAELSGRWEGGFENRAARCLREAGLDASFLDRPGDQLSVGQRQRVTLARALIGEPEALLLDEPTSALDRDTSGRLLETIRTLAASRGVTVVLSTHRLDDASTVADAAIHIVDGGIRDVAPARGAPASRTGPRPEVPTARS